MFGFSKVGNAKLERLRRPGEDLGDVIVQLAENKAKGRPLSLRCKEGSSSWRALGVAAEAVNRAAIIDNPQQMARED